MAVPAIVAYKRDNVGTVLQIVFYFLAFVFIIYTLYKLFGMFKDIGSKIEEKLNEVSGYLNPSDLPNKAKKDLNAIETIITGVLTGKTDSPKYNEALSQLHYGGPEWEPGSAPPVNPKNPVLKRYGQEVKPGESKTFAGATYLEKDVNNMVKDPWGGYATKEDALAHKYGFPTYAQFNAWLEGVKAALKAAGKDPNTMSLDEIVKYGRELERKKEEWKKANPTKATPKLDVMKDTKRPWLKPLPLPEQDKLLRIVYPKTPGGGIEIRYTPVIGGSPGARGLIPVGNGKCLDMRTMREVPCPEFSSKLRPPEKHILPVHPRKILWMR